MILQPKTIRWVNVTQWAAKWFTACRSAILEITGYAIAIFLAETLVKIWCHQ